MQETCTWADRKAQNGEHMQIAPLSATLPVPASPSSAQVAATTQASSLSNSSSATSNGDSSRASSSQPSAAAVAEYMVSAAFSTTFKGKAYAGTVEQANGVYTGVIANLPGAAATGSSIEIVETNLGRMIDTLA